MKSIVSICIACAFAFGQGGTFQDIYPQGKKFPLGLYSIAGDKQKIEELKKDGWNFGQVYSFEKNKEAFLSLAKAAEISVMASIQIELEKELPKDKTIALISECAESENVLWWDMPEERRFWYSEEFDAVKNVFNWSREYDPYKRPCYMYIASQYIQEDIKHYLPYLDIIPSSVYTTYTMMPHAWVRWRNEETVNAIVKNGYEIGPNYLKGQKTPVAIIELFYEPTKDDVFPVAMGPQGAYHDFWQSIVSGAKGIIVFSLVHGTDPQSKYYKDIFTQNWQQYCKAAGEISGSENIGQAVLFGKKIDTIKTDIIDGCTRTPEFVPHGTKLPPISYPSVDTLAIEYEGYLYLIAVNSSESYAKACFSNIPKSVKTGRQLFSCRDKIIDINDAKFEHNFASLGVAIFKFNLN